MNDSILLCLETIIICLIMIKKIEFKVFNKEVSLYVFFTYTLNDDCSPRLRKEVKPQSMEEQITH